MTGHENGDTAHDDSEEKEVKDQPEIGDDEEDDPPSGEGLSEEIYEVESIISHQYKRGELFFKVRWKNYSEEYDTLEPASNLTSAALVIQEYWKNSKDNQTPKKTPKSKKSSSAVKAKSAEKTPTKVTKKETTSSSRSRKNERKEVSVEKEPEESEDNVSDKDDDEEYSDKEEAKQSAKNKRPVSKGALKSYDSSKATSSQSVLSTPKQIAIKARSGWLFDESDDSDADEAAGTTEVKEKPEEVAKVTPKEAVKEKPKEAAKRKMKEPSPVSPPSKKPNVAREEIEEQVDTAKKYSKSEKAAEIIDVFNQNGKFKIVIAEGDDEKLIPLKDAHERFGYKLVEYLANKVTEK